jgi:hypothetical protein
MRHKQKACALFLKIPNTHQRSNDDLRSIIKPTGFLGLARYPKYTVATTYLLGCMIRGVCSEYWLHSVESIGR